MQKAKHKSMEFSALTWEKKKGAKNVYTEN